MSTSPNATPHHGAFQHLNSLTLGEAAQAYAAMGLCVFPLQQGSKLPMPGWSWRRAATTDIDTIRSWWAAWPLANIGIAMGAVSGVDALDIDVKNGHDGLRSYQAIAQGEYPGPVQHTPTGGQHLLFLHTSGLINFTHKGQMGGLDMRTTGGYIVAAPSVTPAGAYLWQRDGVVPNMPHALLGACQQWSTQANTQVVDMPEVPEDLPDTDRLGLQQKYLDYLNHGDCSAWNNDESVAVFATAGALTRAINDAGQVFGILLCNPFAWACAQRHRPFGDAGVWLWKYGIAKIVAAVRAPLDASQVFSPLPATQQGPAPAATASKGPAPTFLTRGSEGVVRAKIAPQWLVRGLIEQRQVGLLYGDSQALKSYLMLDLSAAIATGQPWHGIDVVAPGPVWFLAGEGNAILWRRLEAYRQVRGRHAEDLQDLWISSQGLNLMDPMHLQYLKEQVSYTESPPSLIVVDTLTTNAILDENNAKDTAQLIAICYKIAAEWGCTVILVHHVGKSNKSTVRGSSVLQSNTDFRLRMDRLPGQRVLTQMTVEKLKGAPEPRDPFTFEGISRPIIGVLDDDLVPVSDLVLERISGDELRELGHTATLAKLKLTQTQADLYGHLKEIIVGHWSIAKPGDGLLREELLAGYRARIGPGAHKSHFDRGIDRLISRGLLELRTEGEFQVICMPKGKTNLTTEN